MVAATQYIFICRYSPQNFEMIMTRVSMNYNADNDIESISGTGSPTEGILKIEVFCSVQRRWKVRLQTICRNTRSSAAPSTSILGPDRKKPNPVTEGLVPPGTV